MKAIILLLLILFAIITGFLSCKKTSHDTVDADLIAAFDFKPGTYWIYRDSISGRVDSFAVKSNTLSSLNPGGNGLIDEISIVITEYNVSSPADTSIWVIGLFGNYEEINWYNYFDIAPLFCYPFKTGVPIVSGGLATTGGFAIATNIYPNYMIGMNNYINIDELNSYNSNGTYTSNYWFYVGENIGIIKMRIYDTYFNLNKIWEVQRYNIIK